MTSDGAEPYWGFEEIAASPCGGVYVAGRAEADDLGVRAALWHFCHIDRRDDRQRHIYILLWPGQDGLMRE